MSECLMTSPSVALAIDNGELRADVRISADLGNAVVASDGGVFLASQRRPSTRVYRQTNQAVDATIDTQLIEFEAARWSYPASFETVPPVALGPDVVVPVTGIYDFALQVVWSGAGASPGTYRAVAVTGIDSDVQWMLVDLIWMGAFATAGFSSHNVTHSYGCLVYLEAGHGLRCALAHDSGVARNLLAYDADGVELSVNLVLPIDDGGNRATRTVGP